MGPEVAFVVLSAFPLWAVAQRTLEWPNAPVRAVPWLLKAPLTLLVLHSALAPNTGEYKCTFSFIIAQVIFLSKPPSLTLHPFRVEMRVSASAMLIPGHYLKRLTPISHPYGDVLLAKYRACARGHVLELQRVANYPVSQGWNASLTLGKSNIAPLNPKWVRGPPSGPLRGT